MQTSYCLHSSLGLGEQQGEYEKQKTIACTDREETTWKHLGELGPSSEMSLCGRSGLCYSFLRTGEVSQHKSESVWDRQLIPFDANSLRWGILLQEGSAREGPPINVSVAGYDREGAAADMTGLSSWWISTLHFSPGLSPLCRGLALPLQQLWERLLRVHMAWLAPGQILMPGNLDSPWHLAIGKHRFFYYSFNN